ncbi:MAG: hypothetical protein ACE5IY_14030 [bacterium]
MALSQSSGGFTTRDSKTRRFIQALQKTVLTEARYFRIETGIEHRFGKQAAAVHGMLYRSLGPTTDLLRYFPDSLYFDRTKRLPTWDVSSPQGEPLAYPAASDLTGLFTFFVEYKYSGTERPRPIGDVATKFIGQIEREAWLTYRRLTSPNPQLGTYLDGKRTRIALFYAAAFAPEKLYGGWEEQIEPIFVRGEIARPGSRSVATRGSGTPWINFDVRQLEPLAEFLVDELFWQQGKAKQAVAECKEMLF